MCTILTDQSEMMFSRPNRWTRYGLDWTSLPVDTAFRWSFLIVVLVFCKPRPLCVSELTTFMFFSKQPIFIFPKIVRIFELELYPRVGARLVGVKKSHAWGGKLTIFGVSSGCFWIWIPTQYPRFAWGFSRSRGKFLLFSPNQRIFHFQSCVFPVEVLITNVME